MRFCPKCNARLKQKQEEKKLTKLVCVKCGYSTTSQVAAKAETKKTPKAEKSTASIKVLGEEDEDIKPLPTTNIECPKCKHDTAAWWMLQTRGGDEPTTQFYRCVKCNHTWRHYA
ncbi:MAG: DNA-directed RNA polymerase subunit M [Candidatus Nitrosomirales archaeon]|jgi:DNA-directed RNA polymerase subunit M